MPDTGLPRPIIVAPSLLSADFSRLGEEVRAVDAAGADWIHVDVMDGRFVPNITIGPVVVEAVRRSTKKPLNVHLMIVEPDRYLAAFAKAGADHLLVHAEPSATLHLHRVLSQIHDLGKKASVVLDPASPSSRRQDTGAFRFSCTHRGYWSAFMVLGNNMTEAERQAKALARWEGEGGALDASAKTDQALDEAELRILSRLGIAQRMEHAPNRSAGFSRALQRCTQRPTVSQ